MIKSLYPYSRKRVPILRFAFVCGMIVFSLSAKAQLNLKIGYSIGLFDPGITNDILRQYNLENQWLENDFKDLNLMSGIVIGFRNSWDFVGLDLSWTSKFNREFGEGPDPSTGNSFSRTYYYRLNTFSAGLEFYPTSNFGFGGSIDATDLNYKVDGTGYSDTEKIVDGFSMGSHFFLSYEISTSDFLSVSFRPYIQLPWESFNIQGFEQANFPDSTDPASEFEENLFNFGLMIVFFNGNPRG